MKKYIKSTTDYIGGKLYEVADGLSENESWQQNRYETQEQYITEYSSYYIVYRPESEFNKFELYYGSGLLNDVTESMAIKEGIDVIAHSGYIEIVAYYGSFIESAYLYPISKDKFDELQDILEESDFTESITIENEIAQYAWNGSDPEIVLLSWA